jgi:hypothetical protein
MTPEGRVKVQVKGMLKEHRAYQFWPVQTGMGKRTLDCLGTHRGRFFAIETKAPGAKLTPPQELIRQEIQLAGGTVFVIGETESETDPYKYSGLAELEAWLLLS